MYNIKVKKYMTKQNIPFNVEKNNNIPMPLIEMSGNVLEETRGMYKMQLHGIGKETVYCLRCGKELTNDISRHYGMGPECGKHFYHIDENDSVESIKDKISEIKWTGWIPKSAIIHISDQNGNTVNSMHFENHNYSDIIIKTGNSIHLNTNNSIFIVSEYIPELVDYIRTLSHRYYDRSSKIWEISYEYKDQFKQFLISNKLKFTVSNIRKVV